MDDKRKVRTVFGITVVLAAIVIAAPLIMNALVG